MLSKSCFLVLKAQLLFLVFIFFYLCYATYTNPTWKAVEQSSRLGQKSFSLPFYESLLSFLPKKFGQTKFPSSGKSET